MKCTAKHTKYQPTNEEFNCPKCGAKVGDFVVEEPAEGVSEDCEELHASELLRCELCGYETSASAFANRLQRAKNLVPCPHCKGSGLVVDKKGAKK